MPQRWRPFSLLDCGFHNLLKTIASLACNTDQSFNSRLMAGSLRLQVLSAPAGLERTSSADIWLGLLVILFACLPGRFITTTAGGRPHLQGDPASCPASSATSIAIVGRSAASLYMGAGEKQTIEKKPQKTVQSHCLQKPAGKTKRGQRSQRLLSFESDFAAGLHPRKMGPRVGPGPPQSPGRWVCHARPSQTCTGRRIGRRTLSPAGGFAKERTQSPFFHSTFN